MNHARLLRILVDDAKNAPLPPVDWQRVESNLFSSNVRPLSCLPTPKRPSSLALACGVAALAASLALALTSLGSSGSPAPLHARIVSSSFVPVEQNAAVVDASSLQPGDQLVADSRPLQIRHPGKASWSLPLGSIATIESLSPSIHIHLDLGSLHADVVPSSTHDSFVVRVHQTRVGVHGTSFTVDRFQDKLRLKLFRGVVAVGPNAKRGPTMGLIMLAPSALECSLDGAKRPVFLPAPELPLPAEAPDADLDFDASLPSVDSPPLPKPPVALAPRPSSKGPGSASLPPMPELPEQLTASDVASTLSALSAQIASCYERHASKADRDGVTVSVQTTVRMTIAPEGFVRFGRFEPPLAPDAQRCASSVLSSTTFPKAKAESMLLLPLKF